MFKKNLCIEQLEWKDLFAGLVDAEAPAAVGEHAVGNPVHVEVSADHITVATVDRAGDVTGDGQLDQSDLVKLLQLGKYGTGQRATADEGDFNGDGVFDRLDFVQIMIESQYTPHQQPRLPGDADLDGLFGQDDIIKLLQQGKYNTGEPADWSHGDFDGNGVFNQSDLILALQAGNYESGRYAALGEDGGVGNDFTGGMGAAGGFTGGMGASDV